MTHFLLELREWTMWLMEGGILYFVAKEFYYDKAKDDKRTKRTKTTKKTTKPDGSVTEEQSEEVISQETKP